MTADRELDPSLTAESPRPVHTFMVMTNPDGSRFVAIYKRVDIHEIAQIGGVLLMDASISPSEIGRRCCAQFDAELQTRGAARE